MLKNIKLKKFECYMCFDDGMVRTNPIKPYFCGCDIGNNLYESILEYCFKEPHT